MAFEWGPKTSLSFAAGADLSTKQYTLVNLDSAKLVQAVAVAGQGFAVLQNAPKAGETAECLIAAGASKVKLGGTVAVGDWLTSDGAGLAVKATVGTDETKIAFGRALEAGVVNQIIAASVSFAGGFPSTDV